MCEKYNDCYNFHLRGLRATPCYSPTEGRDCFISMKEYSNQMMLEGLLLKLAAPQNEKEKR